MSNTPAKRGNGSWPPFEPGHQLSRKHGAYAELTLGRRADELAESIRVAMEGDGLYQPSFEFAIKGLALAKARLEAAATAEQPSARLESDMRGWANTLLKYADALGLTPTARARLGLDVAQTRRALGLVEMAEAAARHRAAQAAADAPHDPEVEGGSP